jgi:fibronectin type 3 domain-containing protein
LDGRGSTIRRFGSVAALAATLVCFATGSAQASGGIAVLPTPTAQTNGEVDAIAVYGTTAYIGGTFTAVRPAGSPSGSGNVGRQDLAAIDLTTGDVLPWNPGANGDVRALTVSPDGSTIFAGGAFTSLGGVSRNRIGAVTSSGAVTPWNPGASGPVRALTIVNSKLYVGGEFTSIGGAGRSRLAAFDLPGGTLDTAWQPSANNWVTALVPALDGSDRIFAGGYFTSMNGDSSQQYLTALDTATGANTGWQDHPESGDHVDALTATATQLFAAEGGPGGKAEGFDQSTGARQWTAQVDGDAQAIAASGSLVYVGGHFVNYCVGGTGSGAPYECTTPLARGKLLALVQADGSIDDWNPSTNGPLGVYALAICANGLCAGGQMTTYGLNLPQNEQVSQQGFAYFGAVADTTPPTPPQNLVVSPTGSTSVHLTWGPATDNVGVTNYRVYRDGAPVQTIGDVTSYDDTGLQPSTSYTYTVTALDAAGNESQPSNSYPATTDPATTTVFADGFESGNLSLWNHVSGAVTVETTNVDTGTYAADASPAGTPAWAWASITPQTDLTDEVDFKINSKTSPTVALVQFRQAGGKPLLTVSLAGAKNRLRVTDPTSKTTVTATTRVTTGVWHHLLVRLLISTTGQTSVSLDGTDISELDQTLNTGVTPVGRISFGDPTKGRTSDVTYDNVNVHT